LAKIVELQVGWLQRRLQDRRIGLEFSGEAKNLLAERGYDPVYGARPLKRVIQRTVETPLAKKIMAGDVPDGSAVRVVVRNREIAFEVTLPDEEGATRREAAQAG